MPETSAPAKILSPFWLPFALSGKAASTLPRRMIRWLKEEDEPHTRQEAEWLAKFTFSKSGFVWGSHASSTSVIANVVVGAMWLCTGVTFVAGLIPCIPLGAARGILQVRPGVRQMRAERRARKLEKAKRLKEEKMKLLLAPPPSRDVNGLTLSFNDEAAARRFDARHEAAQMRVYELTVGNKLDETLPVAEREQVEDHIRANADMLDGAKFGGDVVAGALFSRGVFNAQAGKVELVPLPSVFVRELIAARQPDETFDRRLAASQAAAPGRTA